MRLIRNAIQTPRKLVAPEDRKKPAFFVLLAGLGVLALGALLFFLAYIMRDYIKENMTIPYRDLQTYGLLVSFIGVGIYMIGANVLKVPIRNTTFYKLKTIVQDELYDPQRKGDFTKSIFGRLNDFSDEWSLISQVNPPEAGAFIIPQVIIGPGGVTSLWPLGEHPDRKAFKDPGKAFDKASKLLENALGVPVTPLMVFSTSKVLQMYRKKVEPATRTLTLLELEDYFERRKRKLTEDQISDLEAKVFAMIKGTPPGEKFW